MACVHSTIVCVRSMTKPLVGTALLMLNDEGKLSVTERASKYLRAFDNDRSRSIAIEQLFIVPTPCAGTLHLHARRG